VVFLAWIFHFHRFQPDQNISVKKEYL